jgi:Long-chain acyl-CoA synthetases (AMP-forming)
VPRVYEKIHAAVVGKLDAETGAKRAVAQWALRVGYRVSALKQQKRSVPPLLALQHGLADRLVYTQIKNRLGGRLRVANSGGAPLPRATSPSSSTRSTSRSTRATASPR